MLYIMRHGRTVWNMEHKLQGKTDVPLSEAGRSVVEQAAAAYQDTHIDVCYCSPLIRAMETAEIVKGIVQETEPDAVIVVDALAARSAGRLGVTVQLSDTGIQPGSGVGNHRSGLTEETLGIPVFAIGIPMVVGAAAIVYDTVGAMTEVLREKIGCDVLEKDDEVMEAEDSDRDRNGEKKRKSGEKKLEILRVEESYELVKELLKPDLGPMYVTPHDIDERVDFLSFTISEAIHEALFRTA